MKYVIGIDLGTSAVKVLLVNNSGEVVFEVSESLSLMQSVDGHSEQDPNEWVEKTILCLKKMVEKSKINVDDIEGISFSGQMHGLVLIDEYGEILRPAILWNDTRTTEQCKRIYDTIGENRLLDITKNPALEGFTLPKLLWVQENEPHTFDNISKFLLPKDYLRYRLSGRLNMEYSDAAGTLLLDVVHKRWSEDILRLLSINPNICPYLVDSHKQAGYLKEDIVKKSGLSVKTKIFPGGADNACGALGSGVSDNRTLLCSIGTSGVILSHEGSEYTEYNGNIHYFNHVIPNSYYSMGVTLAAGYSLSWLKETFFNDMNFEAMLQGIDTVPVGSNELLFTPYILGERTPYADAYIRGSFIGMDASHQRKHFVRSVLEGITFSLNEIIEIFRENGKKIESIISIGGGSKNEYWLQMQADIFNTKIVKLSNEQGPGLGATMIAAYGCGWFESLEDCGQTFLKEEKCYFPNKENVDKYQKIYSIYKEIYPSTVKMNHQLAEFSNDNFQ